MIHKSLTNQSPRKKERTQQTPEGNRIDTLQHSPRALSKSHQGEMVASHQALKPHTQPRAHAQAVLHWGMSSTRSWQLLHGHGRSTCGSSKLTSMCCLLAPLSPCCVSSTTTGSQSQNLNVSRAGPNSTQLQNLRRGMDSILMGRNWHPAS
jgi:hypothetical protein